MDSMPQTIEVPFEFHRPAYTATNIHSPETNNWDATQQRPADPVSLDGYVPTIDSLTRKDSSIKDITEYGPNDGKTRPQVVGKSLMDNILDWQKDYQFEIVYSDPLNSRSDLLIKYDGIFYTPEAFELMVKRDRAVAKLKADLESSPKELRSVYFETNSAEISEVQKKSLEDYKAGQYTLEGHADKRGPAAKNKELSENRVDAVAQELISNGAEVYSFEAYGEEKATAKSKEGMALERRVDISPK